MNLEQLKSLQEKPAPFTPGEPLFWDDPHISAQMLAIHLDPNTDLASRRPETIDRSVAWMIETLGLKKGDRLLDLGCGPGLYASRFAERGLEVTGIDYSRRSIEYAKHFAADHGLNIRYRYENYLDLSDSAEYDAACLIFGDYCPLAPEQREKLLSNVRRALKSGGRFVLDVSTPAIHRFDPKENHWSVEESGFWKPGMHMVLEQGFDYPDQNIHLDQYVVIEPGDKITVYRNWFQDFTRETITQELKAGGVEVQGVWSDLTGTPFAEDPEWIGIVAKSIVGR